MSDSCSTLKGELTFERTQSSSHEIDFTAMASSINMFKRSQSEGTDQ